MLTDQRKSVEPIAIVGMGCLFPKAGELRGYWANIKNAVDAITEIPESHWRPEDYFDADQKRPDFTYGRRGGFLEPFAFDPLAYGMPPNTLEATDTSQLLGMVAAERALRDAGYAEKPFDRDRVSVILGVTGALELVIPLGARLGHPLWRAALKDAGVDDATADDVVQRIGDRYVGWQEASFPGLLGNVVAGRITKHLNLGGTNCVVDAACASSLSAVHLAVLELEAGRSDMVITGGVDTFNDIFMYMCFSKTPALSPSGHAKPFDATGDGTTLGEGLGMVVLKRLSDAERDGDRVYACIRGIGASSDGKGDAIYAPSAKGQTKALRRAYENAGIAPESIELVEAHGTGTAAGDSAEVTALLEVYGKSDSGPWCGLGSVKSQIGHTKAAAGAAALIKTTLALYHKVLPPTIKVSDPLPLLKQDGVPFYVNTEARPWVKHPAHPRRAALSALGFGGSNFHCVLEEHTAAKAAPDWNGDIEILAFQADTAQHLATSIAAFGGDDWDSVLREAQALRAVFHAGSPQRLLVVVRRDQDVAALLGEAESALAKRPEESWSLPSGSFHGVGAAAGKLACVFPGQGGQRVGMLRELACTFPEFLESLETADAAFHSAAPTSGTLHQYIYPHPVFSAEAREQQEAELRATGIAQPAIGAVSAAAYKILKRFGVEAEAFAGHSFGELTALYAAGCYDENTLIRLSATRGALMGKSPGGSTMLAVRAGTAKVEGFIRETGLKLTLANKNAPEQTVLSGAIGAIEHAASWLKDRGVSATRLAVAAGFHSEHVSDAQAPFLDALHDVQVHAPQAPVYGNTTGAPYPHDPAALRAQLAAQLANPVEFVTQIERMYAEGVRTFVEVGPGARMTGLVQSILEGRPITAAAIDTAGPKRCGIEALARLLAQIGAAGHDVQLAAWNDGCAQEAPAKKPRMVVTLTGANHVTPRPARPAAPIRSLPVPEAPARAAQPTQGTSSTIMPQTPSTSPVPPAGGIFEQSLIALQRMQEQTAALHRQFLEGQQAALATFQQLLMQQPAGAIAAFPQPAPIVTPSAPVAAPPVAVAPPPIVPTVAADTKVAELLLGVVADKTGYPREMLELGMSLDADLGIDSIKRVEILSVLREALPDAPELGADQAGQLQTLQQIVDHLSAGLDAAAPAARPAPQPASSPLTEILLGIVAEKTGYPQEMLELDMSLDADLGIDSIKRVEILATLRERAGNLPEVDAQSLGQIQTLRQIVEQLGAAVPEAAPAAATSTSSAVVDLLLETVAAKTGYPVEMLELSMTLDADLGIDSIKRVEILSALQEKLPGAPSAGPEAVGKLHTLAEVAAFLSGPAAAPAPIEAEQPVPPAGEPRTVERMVLSSALLEAREPLHNFAPPNAPVLITDAGDGLAQALGRVLEARGITTIIAPLNAACPELLGGLIVLAPAHGVTDAFLLDAFQLARSAAPKLRATPNAFFFTVSRLDGCFGYRDAQIDFEPLAGGLAGLAKTAHHEWPEVRCQALDAAPEMSPEAAADAIADEIWLSGPREIGLAPEGRRWLQLSPVPAALLNGLRPLAAGDPIIITGGARGVTAEVAVALARHCQCTLLLFGRSPIPQPEPAWLAGLNDEAAIKRALIGRGVNTPKELARESAAIRSNREILANIARMNDAGARVEYRSLDIRDAAAVRAEVQALRAVHGPIKGIVHGAGVLADRLIEDKTVEQFTSVYETKVAGLRTLLDATREDPLRVMVFFSSSTGRYGRRGQVDYAMANEVLNKMAHAERNHRPECRVVSVNWGPWEGGMVTPGLKKVFEDEGVGLIDLNVGAEYLLQEISQDKDPAVEVVVLGFPVPKKSETPAAINTSAPAADGPMQTAFTLDLSVDAFPFLRSHVLKGRAVLPVVMMIEWMAHAALHGHPGLHFHGIDGLRVLKGVTLARREKKTLQLLTGAAVKHEGLQLVPVELRDNEGVPHAAARVVLGMQWEAGTPVLNAQGLQDEAQPASACYEDGTLFHGEAFQALATISSDGAQRIAALAKPAPAPAQWIERPLRSAWITDPLALDAALQLPIIWGRRRHGAVSLPASIDAYRQYRAFPRQAVQVVVQVDEHNAQRMSTSVEFLDAATGELIARIRGSRSTLDPALDAAFHANTLVEEAVR